MRWPVVTTANVWRSEADTIEALPLGGNTTMATSDNTSMRAALDRMRLLVTEALNAAPDDAAARETIEQRADFAHANGLAAIDPSTYRGTAPPAPEPAPEPDQTEPDTEQTDPDPVVEPGQASTSDVTATATTSRGRQDRRPSRTNRSKT